MTLYIAPSEVIGQSLQMASCRPVTPEQWAELPIATREQIQQAVDRRLTARRLTEVGSTRV